MIPAALEEFVARWRERAASVPALVEASATLSEERRAELERIVAGSEFAAAALLRDPQALNWVLRCEEPAANELEARDYERRVAAADDAASAQRTLREWRRRAMLRIAWRDIVGRASLVATLHALSDLADGCLRAAVIAAQRHLEPVFGRPRNAQRHEVPFIVVAMGKLGGRELNFSSDIDLIFLYAEGGATDGARSADNSEYFNRLGRDVIRLLDARTEDGCAFRVDMRLRPFGESGPLVVSLASLENYLQEHGRDWERYAWIKARPVVGIMAYQCAMDAFIRPFVYRRYLDYGVFDSLRDMKALIAREVARNDLDQHLKLGAGGIRELEFIVQSLQLVRGGNDRRLQNAALLDILPLLAGSKLLPKAAVAELQDAYTVLRRAENAVQMIRDEQVHTLPEEALDRARLALNLGLSDWSAASGVIDRARQRVARQFEALVFAVPQALHGRSDAVIDWLAADEVGIDAELRAVQFPEAQLATARGLLDQYRRAASYRRLDEGARRRVHVILTRLLQAAAQRPDPTIVLERVLRILEAIGARSSYLALLKEQPPALERLIEVCAISGFLARQIADFPLLLDELIDPNAFDELPSRLAFEGELNARTERLPAEEPERQVEALRQFQKAAVFCVAFADLTGRLPLMKVSDRLTDIAELIVARCVSLAWDQMTHAHGTPRCTDPAGQNRIARIAVAGYGKLGGLELGYGSDLDLVFLHDSAGDGQHTDGERPLDNGLFFLRLGQRIVHLLTMHSAAGRLYEVDMRLRPNGKSGFLMTGIDAFESYQRQEAWTWEHQALLRARAIAGDPGLCARFERARRHTLASAVHRDTLRVDVLEMRLRMRRELSRSGAGQFDIKQDAGGLADIEFLVQYLVLAAATDHPELLDYSDNIRQLDGLAAAARLEREAAEWLKRTYVEYRTVLHRLSLEGGERVVDAMPYRATRERVSALWREIVEVNPLLLAWQGPHAGVPPLDRVRSGDFKAGFEVAMAEQLREIDSIANHPEAPTFDNTLVALERSGQSFKRVNALFELWSTSMNTGDFQAVERELTPKVAAFHDSIAQNTRLFARVEALYQRGAREPSRPAVDAVDLRLIERYHNRFVRAGARASAVDKARIATINQRLAALFTEFGQHLLADEAGHTLFITAAVDLEGLPDSQRTAAAVAAAELGRPGQWAIQNTRSAMEPFLTYSTRRELRERVWRTYYNRGNNGDATDNKHIVTEVLALRRERARLLGFPSHAHWHMTDSMAGTPERALDLLMRVWPSAVARALTEIADMQAIVDAAGDGIEIAAWDYRFYAEKVRQARFDLDANEIKPYLQLERLREGMFWMAERLYGLEFVRVQDVPVYHADVRVWEVRASSGRHVGRWYFDPYARAGKNSGAWMSEYRDQSTLDQVVPPIVSNNTNFLKAAAADPVLISWDDAVTLFHEFGHALHGLNSNVKFASLSGTHVVRDFVELPSQLHENWLATPELLTRFAVHYRTGEPMPASLLAKIKAARRFNQGFATAEYLAAALVDMRLHLADEAVADPEEFERSTLAAIGMPKEIVMRHRTPQFAHIFAGDGYAAGYYSYLWAEVLAQDAYEAFVEAGDPFDKTVAKRLHDEIMSSGNSVEPGAAFRRFRGRDPRIDALLLARGFSVE